MSCPFCRELYSSDEAERCPHCDIPLVRFEALPPSPEALEEGLLDPPEDYRFAPWTFRYFRGPLVALSLAGLAFFRAPWVYLERPDPVGLTGFDLARGNAPWLWGGAVGFFLLVPLVLSRRTQNELRGVRVVAATFALMTVLEALLLVARPPVESAYFGAALSYGWGLGASAGVSLLAFICACRLGAGASPRAPYGRPLRSTRTADTADRDRSRHRPEGALSHSQEKTPASRAEEQGRTLH